MIGYSTPRVNNDGDIGIEARQFFGQLRFDYGRPFAIGFSERQLDMKQRVVFAEPEAAFQLGLAKISRLKAPR